jgi:RNA polymerase sigma-70 factor (ECF subfamily)
MNHAALRLTSATENVDPPEPRRRYEVLVQRAMRYAVRLLPRDQAFEIAHEVAVELLDQPPSQISGTIIYLRVTSRVRNAWRSNARRASLDAAWLESRPGSLPSWAQPGAELEAEELHERIRETLVAMPASMRETFLLVREEELSYREAAERLGVSVSTVHTQLSRANALLRKCVEQYLRTGTFRRIPND